MIPHNRTPTDVSLKYFFSRTSEGRESGQTYDCIMIRIIAIISPITTRIRTVAALNTQYIIYIRTAQGQLLSLNHLLLRLISTLLKLEISTPLKTITNSCFQALEGLKFQALEGLKGEMHKKAH